VRGTPKPEKKKAPQGGRRIHKRDARASREQVAARTCRTAVLVSSSPNQKRKRPRKGAFFFSGWGRGIRTPVDGVRVRSPTTRRSPKTKPNCNPGSGWAYPLRGYACRRALRASDRTPVDGVRVRSPTTRRSPKSGIGSFNASSTASRGEPCADRLSCARPRGRRGSRNRPCGDRSAAPRRTASGRGSVRGGSRRPGRSCRRR
jgi:hypothetical protein